MLGDERERDFADFVGAMYPGLVSRMGARLRDPAAGEDVVQEALARAWERTLTGAAIDSLPAWITTAALNLGRDRWRRRRAEEQALWRLAVAEPGLLDGIIPSEPEPEPDVGPEDLAAHLAALPRRQREVVLLHYFADLPVREVAATLGVSEGTVKQCLFRARQHLQRILPSPTAQHAARRVRQSTPERSHPMKGWFKAGRHPREYAHGIADDELLDGRRVALLKSTTDKPGGFGTVMQMIDAAHYRGKRIRFSAQLRTAGIDGTDDFAGLWLRVDGPSGQRVPLAFDNMQTGKRELKGTLAWARHDIVLDVAPEAAAVGFGFLLRGSGELRVAGLGFDEVGLDVPTTNTPPPALPEEPQNLDLSEE